LKKVGSGLTKQPFVVAAQSFNGEMFVKEHLGIAKPEQ
jgi:hypothetical protein